MTKPKKLTRRWLTRWADKMADKADVEKPHWFIHNAGGEERTYCFDCGEKRRQELIATNQGKPEVLRLLDRLDGGFSTECDSCEHCETCGQLLDYSLTDYGAKSEWDHFQEHGINLSSADCGYHIQTVLQSLAVLRGLANVRLHGRLKV